jgi:hypothetical protein
MIDTHQTSKSMDIYFVPIWNSNIQIAIELASICFFCPHIKQIAKLSKLYALSQLV